MRVHDRHASHLLQYAYAAPTAKTAGPRPPNHIVQRQRVVRVIVCPPGSAGSCTRPCKRTGVKITPRNPDLLSIHLSPPVPRSPTTTHIRTRTTHTPQHLTTACAPRTQLGSSEKRSKVRYSLFRHSVTTTFLSVWSGLVWSDLMRVFHLSTCPRLSCRHCENRQPVAWYRLLRTLPLSKSTPSSSGRALTQTKYRLTDPTHFSPLLLRVWDKR